MTRLRSFAIAFVALALSAGAALAFTDLPEAALSGLGVATEKADRDLPARPAAFPVPADADLRVAAEDLPDAASHGVEVSDAAKPDDPPADSDHGGDVSEVARDNNGATAVDEHKPADAGPPDDPGPPEDPGVPGSVELPDDAPDDPGPPADPGQPEEPGRPN
jgi:hypothetical protein